MPPASPSAARTTVVLTVMFVVVAAAFGAVVGYFAIGTTISRLAISNDEPACPGTTLTGQRRAITLDPDLRCTVAVTVRNEGRLTVHLDEIVLPLMGSEGGAAVRVTSWEGHPTPRRGRDAVFALDRALEPGETWETEVRFVFRPDGCTALGTFSAGLPDIRAGAWGRSVLVGGPGVLFEGTPESEC